MDYFLLILIADLLGAFGRGWLTKTQSVDANQGLTVKYERIKRAGTPSILTLQIAPIAVRKGEVSVFGSEEVVRSLGAQRISPQPLRSSLAQGGVDYIFPADGAPAVIESSFSPRFSACTPFASL